MTSHQLGEALSKLVQSERKITNEILALINMALDRRAYLDLGYSSMFDWLVKGFGYSSSAAFRRIEAARLIKSVPDASQKLSEGKVNLSTLSKAQSLIRKHEKIAGTKIDIESKEEIVQSLENKSVDETVSMIISRFPEIANDVSNDRHTIINENQIRYHLNLSNEASQDLQRAKEVLSHKFPEGRDADIIGYALKLMLDKFDPLRKKSKVDAKRKLANNTAEAKPTNTKSRLDEEDKATGPAEDMPKSLKEVKSTAAAAVKSAPKTKPQSKASIRRLTFKASGGGCTFQDPITGKVCGSRYQAQQDHIIPRALGGSDHPSNFRVLCRPHNLLMAERVFGKKLMDNYRGDD